MYYSSVVLASTIIGLSFTVCDKHNSSNYISRNLYKLAMYDGRSAKLTEGVGSTMSPAINTF